MVDRHFVILAQTFKDELMIEPSPRMRRRKLLDPALRERSIYLLPNLFTTAALFAGFYAIVQALNGRFEHAAVAIFVAMVLAGLDGRVARLTHTQSAFRSEEHPSELQSLMRISYAVFCLKKKKSIKTYKPP